MDGWRDPGLGLGSGERGAAGCPDMDMDMGTWGNERRLDDPLPPPACLARPCNNLLPCPRLAVSCITGCVYGEYGDM